MGSSSRPGRRSQLGSCKIHEAQSEGWASRGTWSSWSLQNTESPSAKCVTEEEVLALRIASFDLPIHLLVSELEVLHLRPGGE